jgi:hypothetical protein
MIVSNQFHSFSLPRLAEVVRRQLLFPFLRQTERCASCRWRIETVWGQASQGSKGETLPLGASNQRWRRTCGTSEAEPVGPAQEGGRGTRDGSRSQAGETPGRDPVEAGRRTRSRRGGASYARRGDRGRRQGTEMVWRRVLAKSLSSCFFFRSALQELFDRWTLAKANRIEQP